jgi:succinate dehydrogenase/fumarate reductase-like Fe-S protein
MNLTLKIWRQPEAKAAGKMVTYDVKDISPDMSFLEMLDVLNERLIAAGEDPVAFDSDCREGICGTCCQMIDGEAHGPETGTTVCQLFMRSFKDGDTIVIGGLVSENMVKSVSKVPLLGDLPVLGVFFRSLSDTKKRQELLVFITARIVPD